MASIATHAQRNTIRLQLKQNLILDVMRPDDWDALEPLLDVVDFIRLALRVVGTALVVGFLVYAMGGRSLVPNMCAMLGP